jgi:rhamnogalacturonyl hydrolase YesR
MKRPISAMVLCGVLFLSTAVSGDEFSPDSIKTLMKKAANYSFQQFGAGTAAGLIRDCSRGTIMTGIMGLYRVTQDKQWLDSVDKWGTKWAWQPGSQGADDYCSMQTYCERYIVEPVLANASKYNPSQTFYNDKIKNPMTNFLEWIDVLYMGPPGMAMLGNITGKRIYFDSLLSAWNSLKGKTFSSTYGLWWRDPSFVNSKTKQGNPSFWGPGNAWVIGGWIRSLKYMPNDYPLRANWVIDFKTFCDTIRTKQQSDGMWRTSLFNASDYPDPEAGSTAFYTYAFSLGIVMGILDSTVYKPVIKKAWAALVKCVDKYGQVQRCQAWSNSPGDVGLNNTPEGQGAFMLAGEGLINLITTTTINKQRLLHQEAVNSKGKTSHLLFYNSNENRPIVVRENAVLFSVFKLDGQLVWKKNISYLYKGQIVALPFNLLSKGLYYIRVE